MSEINENMNIKTTDEISNNAPNKEYRYDAFISYRHLDPDQKVAVRLHRLLEAFRLPSSLIKKGENQKTGIKRVFRDQEELPLAQNLEDPIIRALESTEWLIVLCSTKLQLSEWCKKEIETFLKLRGRKYIMVALVEGTPENSIPRNLWPQHLKDKKELTEEEKRQLYDVDVRASSDKQIDKCVRDEYLKLVAPMFGQKYSVLREAYMGQQLKKKIRRYGIISLIAIAVSVYFLMVGINIYKKNITINEQYETICYEKSLQYATRSEEYLDNDDREKAIETSYYALTNYEADDNDAARKALFDGLDLYQTGDSFKEEYQIFCGGNVQYLYGNAESNILVMYDDSRTITGWDYVEKETVFTISDVHLGPYSAGLTDNDFFGYIHDGSVVVIDATNGKESMKKDNLNADSLYVNGTDIYIYHEQKVSLMDTENKTYDGEYFALGSELFGNQDYNQIPYIDRDYCFYLGEIGNSGLTSADNLSNLVVLHETSWNEGGVLYAYGPAKNGIDDYHAIGESYLDSKGVFDKRCMDVGNMNDKYFVLTAGKDNRAVHSLSGAVSIAANTKLSVRNIGNKKSYEDLEMGNFDGNRIIPMEGADGSEYCLVLSDYCGALIDLNSGYIVKTENFSDRLVDVITNDNREVLCICKDARQYTFAAGNKDENMGDMMFQFGTVQINNFLKLDDNHYAASLDNSDNVLIYTMRDNELLERADDDSKEEDADIKAGKSALKFADEYEISGAPVINSVCEIPDTSYAFISYDNGRRLVYDIHEEAGVYEWNDDGDAKINAYYGKDKDGNYYISCGDKGYIISKRGKLVGTIENFAGANMKKKMVYIRKNNGKIYSADIYSLDEMIKYAEEIQE